MLYCFRMILPGVVAFCMAAAVAPAAPRTLYATPVLSPDRTRSANVQWDDAGFMGVITVRVYDTSGTLMHAVSLPEIDPSPVDLLWIDENWVAVESHLGERATGYFYVDARSGRGYLMEIFALASDEEWEFSVATNDALSSKPVTTVAHGRSSLFPVLLRDAPWESHDYFRPDLPARLASATNAFLEYRKRSGFRQLEVLCEGEVNSELGAVALARFDNCPEVVCFPVSTTVPLEMLSRVQRHPVEIPVLQALERGNETRVRVRWDPSADGSYVVEGVSGWAEDQLTTRVLMRGRFARAQTPLLPAPPAGEETSRPAVLAQEEGAHGDAGKTPAVVAAPEKKTPSRILRKSQRIKNVKATSGSPSSRRRR